MKYTNLRYSNKKFLLYKKPNPQITQSDIERV